MPASQDGQHGELLRTHVGMFLGSKAPASLTGSAGCVSTQRLAGAAPGEGGGDIPVGPGDFWPLQQPVQAHSPIPKPRQQLQQSQEKNKIKGI